MPGSADSASDSADILRFNTEYLNTLQPSGFAAHKIILKPGMPLTLLRNMNPAKGLCNGTRLVFRRLLGQKLLECTVIESGESVLIPRIQFVPNQEDSSLEWRRRQFPIRPAFAMTINKSQGQTLEQVGLWLQTQPFTHGQLYVAVSRVKHPSNLSIALQVQPGTRPKCDNVVFKELFSQ